MKTFVKKLSEEMLRDIQEVCMDNTDLLDRARRCFSVSKDYLQRLKDHVLERGFKDEEEEIEFFKHLKPSLQKEIIYWSEIFYIVTQRPNGNKKLMKEYYVNLIKQINDYFHRNYFLYTYYKTGHTDLDAQIFLRETHSGPIFPESEIVDLDPNFSTVNSSKIAKFIAMEEVTSFIVQNMELLNGKSYQETKSEDAPKPLIFTGSKAQFIEWVIGSHSTGVFNNGKATLKETFDYFQYCLSIKVANHYGYFQAMRIRKKVRTPFLRLMVDKTEQRMDEADEFPRYG